MLTFLETYGADIIAALIAISGAVTSLIALIKSIRLNGSTTKIQKLTDEKIEITQQGIVEAFKMAKLPTEWKVSVSNQVDTKLDAWGAKFLITLKEHEELRTQLALANTKVLAYTAAFNKLTDAEKQHIEELMKEITEADKVVEV